MRKSLIFSSALTCLLVTNASGVHAQFAALTATGGSFENYGASSFVNSGDPFNYNGSSNEMETMAHESTHTIQGGPNQTAQNSGAPTYISITMPDGQNVEVNTRDIPSAGQVLTLPNGDRVQLGNNSNGNVTITMPNGQSVTVNPDSIPPSGQVLTLPNGQRVQLGADNGSGGYSGGYQQTEVDRADAVNSITSILQDEGPRPRALPYAVPTNLLGNATLNNIAYTGNAWVNPPWNTPYQSQSDSRSWISQLPNGQGYSTTLGFQAPYSGGHGPLVADSYSNVEISFDPLGRAGLPTAGAPYVANLFDGINGSITQAVASSVNIPSLALVQTAMLVQAGILPLHFLITWGAGSSDLDLHLTGPLGHNRFHIYYSSPGSLTNAPHSKLIDDCVSASCGEVIRVEQLNSGGVYRASVFNYGQSGANTNLSSASGVEMMVVRGGTVQMIHGPTDSGSIITGGDILFRGTPTAGQAGDTWTAVEVDPNTGAVTFVNQISTSNSSSNVQ